MSADIPEIGAAAAEFRPGDKVDDDRVRLTLVTQDGIHIEFDLSLIAVAVLALTMQPAMMMAKDRAETLRD